MKNSKLIRVLNTLSKVEIREFKKFLQSPLYNQRTDVQQLLTAILKEKQANPFPDKPYFFQQVLPTAIFDIIKFDLLTSYLFRLLQQYLAWKEWQEDDFEVQLKAVSAYKKRGLNFDSEQLLQKLEIQLNKRPFRDENYYKNLHLLQWEHHQLIDTNTPEETANRWAMTSTLDTQYFATKLKYQCLLLTQQMVYQSDFKIPFIGDILELVEQSFLLKIPVISTYYRCYKMLSQPDQNLPFEQFKQLLFKHSTRFPTIEFRRLLLMGINFCVRKVNKGHPHYLSQLLELYKEGLATNALLENGVLSRITYHNIVGTGLNNEALEWTATFIHNFKKKLEKKYRESTYSFSQARLAYHQKNYAEVLDLLQKSNYRDLLLNLAAKTLLLKIYVELEEDTLLFAHLEAMERYLRRKRVIGYHKKNYLNIIKLTKKMRSINPFDKKAILYFEQDIRDTETLTERKWFLQQVALL